VLVISTPPGLTSKWLVPRLYRFAAAHPEIDVRVSATLSVANFTSDGVDIAIRYLRLDHSPDPSLAIEPLVELSLVPVCSPRLVETHGPFGAPRALMRAPLIHDDTLATLAAAPTWSDWFKAAGFDNVDVSRGLRFNSADHALDAAAEGGGVLLAYDLLAYDELRTGRLVVPVELTLPTGRGYYLVCQKRRQELPHVKAFRAWIKQEMAASDWSNPTSRIVRDTEPNSLQ
jgi:LysR family transcriptional regulator, glycine cleavage system transcriptional activator